MSVVLAMALVEVLLIAGLLGLLCALLLLLLTRHFNYWKKRNVPFVNPSALSSLIAGGWKGLPWKTTQWQKLDEAYWKFKDQPFVGFFEGSRPVMVVKDPELIKFVLTKEFTSFHDRGFPYDEKEDPLSANLFNLEGDKWKFLRSKLSPTFTSGKMKLMFGLMVDIAKELIDILKEPASKNEEVEVKTLIARFTTDIIGSCAFGVNCNSLKDPSSEFYVMGRQALASVSTFNLRLILISISPVFSKILSFKRMFLKETNFFLNLMKETVEFRKKNQVNRTDFVNLMMELRESDPANKTQEFTENLMAAQAFLFFVAGLDNVANTVSFCLHELAFNEDLQRQAAAEVREKRAQHGGELTYEAVRDMELVDRILSEALRMWSPASILNRVVTSPIKLPGSEVTLDTTPSVYIPVSQLHYDPAYYPEPERFDPDRFTEEAKKARHPYVYLPFGEGPRFCIAERFARLEMQLCLAALLHHFHFTPGPSTERRPRLSKHTFTPSPENGFWLKLEERAA